MRLRARGLATGFLRRWRAALACAVLLLAPAAQAAEIPPWLPRYDMDVHLDVDGHTVQVRQRVTWTNRHDRPAEEIVFNAHSHYSIPDDQIGFLAKMAEIMRMMPRESLSLHGPALHVDRILLVDREAKPATPRGQTDDEEQTQDPPARKEDGELPPPREIPPRVSELPFHFDEKINTALVVPLPKPVAKDETVTVDIQFTIALPQKQGRWGQWKGVTFLSNWTPVVAVYDDKGWQPAPFIPWHQPWFNEAGVYTVRLKLPCDQKIACTGSIVGGQDLGDGWREALIHCPAARDFALVTSARFEEFCAEAGPVKLKVLAFPEHAYYANFILKVMTEAVPVYSAWFGPYPYPELTIVESFFGWNGNECSGLIMIDERVFGMPHLAESYVDYLVSHEICHQWWYNLIGTNGYCETFMDEAPATYFSHRLIDQKCGKNNSLLKYPKCLSWLPQIKRENYRSYGLYGTIGRNECAPTVQEMDKYGHVVNLFSMCYDRGSRVIGLIEERLGEAAFFDFLHVIYKKYYFRILRVADFQKELEAYTGRSWEEFFQEWCYGKGMADWAIKHVDVEDVSRCRTACGYKVTVLVQQKAEINEPTTLGIRMYSSEGYEIRLPLAPQLGHMTIDDPPAQIDAIGDNCLRVVVDLPCKPKQIAVDPDQIVVDRNPANNFWKPHWQFRLTPLYTFLDETDLTSDYDRWNFTAGPWVYFAPYQDPWFTRSTMFGVRAGAYRTQFFSGGAYSAYRMDYRDLVAGVDAIFDHTPWPRTQIGGVFEERIANGWTGRDTASRGVLFGRYVFDYGDSLYLPPFQYLEAFVSSQDNFLPEPKDPEPGGARYNSVTLGGMHYHINYLTPYWDPEGGFQFDATYGGGCVEFAQPHMVTHQVSAQLSYVKCLPDGLGYLSDTRLALRGYGAAAGPRRGEFFTLGGQTRLRGYDLSDRQGSVAWIGSLEWRLPVAKELRYDLCDHVCGIRHVYVVPFYDVGNAYVSGNQIGKVAHCLGGGLRVDLAWFSFIERSMFSLDVAKVVNDNTPYQVWLGFTHPF